MVDVYRAILDVLDAGGSGALCTVVASAGSSPQKMGSKMLVRPDGTIVGTIGGGTIEHAVIEQAAAVLASGRATLFKAHLSRDLAMCCGGRMEVFIEPVGDKPWLIVFGGGHVGAALCTVASRAGFRVHVVDERPEFAGAEQHPDAAARTCLDPLDALDELPWGDSTYAVILTHSHRLDEDLLARCVDRPTRYLGMIGSQAKVHRFLKRYSARGVDLARFDHVHAPIGLAIGARDPGEIAVSIVAELVAVRRGADSGRSSFAKMAVTAAGDAEPTPAAS
ncbi:MAG: xanthine dehydrogenase accessory protein XdhC [Proteobacteria bacterium]|nr:xanthine dehydrogenase accessory protein XdhC [Pseudomonadota bacterium]